jgi:hypothetical protein
MLGKAAGMIIFKLLYRYKRQETIMSCWHTRQLMQHSVPSCRPLADPVNGIAHDHGGTLSAGPYSPDTQEGTVTEVNGKVHADHVVVVLGVATDIDLESRCNAGQTCFYMHGQQVYHSESPWGELPFARQHACLPLRGTV